MGPIFEGFVASEIIKQQINLGRRRELYFFRYQRGLEVTSSFLQDRSASYCLKPKPHRLSIPPRRKAC
jgi:predicted AAA+ superfamily ATPase